MRNAPTTSATAQIAPSSDTDGAASPEQAHKRLATHYWSSYVANPLSRLQTGSAVLQGADPSRKRSLLQDLGGNISQVHDWAIGRHGPERAFIATSALGYVLPFALVLGVLAMVAACAQTRYLPGASCQCCLLVTIARTVVRASNFLPTA